MNTTMDKIAEIWSQSAKYNVFCGTETASLAVLTNTELLKIAIIAQTVPYFSLSITMGMKEIMLFSYHNVMEMGLKLEEWEIFTL